MERNIVKRKQLFKDLSFLNLKKNSLRNSVYGVFVIAVIWLAIRLAFCLFV